MLRGLANAVYLLSTRWSAILEKGGMAEQTPLCGRDHGWDTGGFLWRQEDGNTSPGL